MQEKPPGGFIGYSSEFPFLGTPRVSQISTLHQLSSQIATEDGEDGDPAERHAMQLQIAAMLVHDINNALMPLIGQIDILSIQDETIDQPYRRQIQEVRRSGTRLSALIRQLQNVLHGKYESEAVWLDISSILRQTTAVCLWHTEVQAEFELEHTRHIKVDNVQFSRIIQNLVINARQAMESRGTLRIRTTDQTDEEGAAWLEIALEDQGCGIPAEELPRIFDLDYTTKQDGRGLGLAFVKSALKESCGQIRVASTLGQGTTFFLRFPAREPTP